MIVDGECKYMTSNCEYPKIEKKDKKMKVKGHAS